MEIGFSTIGFLLNNVELKANDNIDFVDEVEVVFDLGVDSLPKLNKPIKIHAPYFYTNLASLSKRHLKFSLDEISRVLDFGFDTVVHEGGFTTRFDGYIEKSVKIMETSFEFLTSKYTNIVLENTTNSLFSNFEEFLDFFMNFNVNFCFDISHYFIKEDKFNKPILLKDKYLERIRKVHISDTVQGKDLHLPIGSGNVDFRLVQAFLKDLKDDVSVVIESIPRGSNVFDFYREEIDKLKEIIYG
ncbi:MAG: sugar phosphate isomerase/epimerase family protein [Caldisericum sp.]|uniref:Xylose isomerase-like TIM barrel domain-containing protein n=1 Tax=Caldisericum exile TaxID=693075 RepID=A0A2J6X4X6_9BACT|nr:MAG: hypothetical protein C0175_05235 [Caldisericum exile]